MVEGLNLLQIKEDDKNDGMVDIAMQTVQVISSAIAMSPDAGLIENGIKALFKLVEQTKVAAFKPIYAQVTYIN